MRVSVLINAKSGNVNVTTIQEKINAALFRCNLKTCIPSSLEEMNEFIVDELSQPTDYFIICGGDGTVNKALQTFMREREKTKIPPLVIVSVGTANDLATELGLASKVEKAVRAIYNGVEKNVDVIEVATENQRAYMLTNGGVGIPARSADIANLIREKIKNEAQAVNKSIFKKFIYKKGLELSKTLGSKIYSISLLESLLDWRSNQLNLEIGVPGKMKMDANTSIILVNNQKTIGSSYFPAPFTSNSDGRMNVLWDTGANIIDVVKAILSIKSGDASTSKYLQTMETESFEIRSKDASKGLDFFGDGEILVRNANKISIRCLKNALPIIVDR